MASTNTNALTQQYKSGWIDVIKQFWVYIILSLLVTLPGLVIMGMSIATYPTHAPLRLGIDFTGGTMLQYGFSQTLNQDTDIPKMREAIEKAGIANPVIQLQQQKEVMTGTAQNATTQLTTEKKAPTKPPKNQSVTELFQDANKPTPNIAQQASVKSIVSIRTQDMTTEQTVAMQKSLQQSVGDFVLLQKNRVGPTLAKELFTKAAMGLLLAYALIVIYLSIRFQLDYAVTAIVALVHDTIFMLGTFSMMGWFWHVEVDSLFITAILTVIGFSVHDTIVVFDRIRENSRILYTQKLPFAQIVNISVNQTLARSINTSLTALLTLTALYFFGGESTRHFVFAMILGILTGTYSSIFVASSLLAWWRTKQSHLDNQTSSHSPARAAYVAK